jgi:hypothetical protein
MNIQEHIIKPYCISSYAGFNDQITMDYTLLDNVHRKKVRNLEIVTISYLLEQIYDKQAIGRIASTIGTDQVPRLGVHDHETLVSGH